MNDVDDEGIGTRIAESALENNMQDARKDS